MGFLENLENSLDDNYKSKWHEKNFSMEKIYIDENIFYIENFISQEDIKKILSEIDNAKIYENSTISIIPVHSSENFKNIWGDIKKKLKSLFYTNNTYIKEIEDNPDTPAFAKYKSALSEEWAMAPHYDDTYDGKKIPIDGSNKQIGTRTLKGFIIYITDNYSGGELVYINKGISFKPKSGTLICHPGTEEYTHGVKNFEGGERIVFSAFVHEKI